MNALVIRPLRYLGRKDVDSGQRYDQHTLARQR